VSLPAVVICNLLGFDGALKDNFQIWTFDLAAVSPATPQEMHARIRQTVTDMERYIKDVLADRRRARRDDLVSDLLDAEVDGQRLNEDELVAFLFLLLAAGFETTQHVLSASIRILADRPELVSRLRGEPASIPAFVEEALRFEPPAHGVVRLTLAEASVRGVQIPPGSPVLLLLGSANRDELQFEDPDRFDMDRKQRASLSFGHGIHTCLGATLARTEARIMLEELLPRIQGIRLIREPEWNFTMTLRGPTSCWVEFTAG
jgi:cytochrome P450